MLLYHFLPQQWALKVLREGRLKTADIDSLNDPFDFLSVAAPNKQHRNMLRRWRKQMSQEFGLVCFSRNWHSPVQWAHYADRHRGVCLGFDVGGGHLRQVNYVASRPSWPKGKEFLSQEVQQRIVEQLLYTKYAHWSYEDEYRLFSSKKERHHDGNYYVDFSDDLRLRKILVGACSDITRLDISSALGAESDAVEVFKVRLAFKSYKIVRQKKESEWK